MLNVYDLAKYWLRSYFSIDIFSTDFAICKGATSKLFYCNSFFANKDTLGIICFYIWFWLKYRCHTLRKRSFWKVPYVQICGLSSFVKSLIEEEVGFFLWGKLFSGASFIRPSLIFMLMFYLWLLLRRDCKSLFKFLSSRLQSSCYASICSWHQEVLLTLKNQTNNLYLVFLI